VSDRLDGTYTYAGPTTRLKGRTALLRPLGLDDYVLAQFDDPATGLAVGWHGGFRKGDFKLAAAEKPKLEPGPVGAWDPDWLPPMTEITAIEEAVRRDLKTLRVKKPADLVFHHIFLGDRGSNGPLVFVYGVPGSDVFHLRYDAAPRWVTTTGEPA